MNLSATSGTLKIGTNGSITVSGSNYGTLSCSSSAPAKATCSVSGTTVTITPVAAGSATITVSGAGNSNYNAINKTYAATIEQAITYKCWSKNQSTEEYADSSYPSNALSACTNANFPNNLAFIRYSINNGSIVDREVCIYKNAKLFCVNRDTYVNAYNNSTALQNFLNAIKTAFGVTSGVTCTTASDGGGFGNTATCTYDSVKFQVCTWNWQKSAYINTQSWAGTGTGNGCMTSPDAYKNKCWP